LVVKDTSEGRRLKRTVFDERNNPILSGNENARGEVCLESVRMNEKPVGVRKITHLPAPGKAIINDRWHPEVESKKSYGWTTRPTGWENPSTFEEPVEPGQRPPHPISPVGMPEGGGRRCPDAERVYPKTGIPPPALAIAPKNAGWGGWGPNGEPGRRILDRPWEVADRNYNGPGESVEVVFCDMSKKKFPEQKYSNTNDLTTWHFDPQKDVDPPYQRRIHHCFAVSPDGSGPLPQLPQAGKASGACAEGSSLPWYDTVVGREGFPRV